MLARLRGMVQSLKTAEPAPVPADETDRDKEELLPTWDVSLAPEAAPVAQVVDEPAAALPAALEVEEPPAAGTGTAPETEAGTEPAMATPVPKEEESQPIVLETLPQEAGGSDSTPAPAEPQRCPICQAPRTGTQSYCTDCGWMFPPEMAAPLDPAETAAPAAATYLRGRYELGQLLGERGGLSRFCGWDHGSGTPDPVAILLIRAALPQAAEQDAAAEPGPAPAVDAVGEAEVLSGPPEPLPATLPIVDLGSPELVWPSIAWERELVTRAQHPALPQVLDSFTEGGFEYLVEEAFSGRSLWDAWDDADATAADRFGWLKQIAEALDHLHRAGAILEGLRPDLVTITPAGQAVLTDLSDLLPLLLPPDPPIRATPYTAPELVLASAEADARSDLYSFGAMVYALLVGHELTEADFERQGVPKQFTDHFPDIHPMLLRLLNKTFCREPSQRFPTEEAAKADATGFAELIRNLEVCRRTFDDVRLDLAAWTTTGMVRSGNEDAFAFLHAVESRQDDLNEYALVLLADGMGGYEAGEVAAGLALQALRNSLLEHPLFAALAGDSPPAPGLFDVELCKQALVAALKEANLHVHTASRHGVGRRGMGCTAEAVYVDGRHVVVGHVGDSRTYHLHEGHLIQLTRDQTLVNRLVELGTLTPEEAATHPRRNELQQAIGGQPDVEPGLYHATLTRDDWVIVCSDGLTNHIAAEDLQKMLLREATSAEMAARRLINLVNLHGATDNATVVVIRAT
jgi:protein phosphatase